jgi:hypothetical protein
MKKFTVFSALALGCLSMQAAELTGIRYAGYTTTSVPAGFSIVAVPFSGFDTNSFSTSNLSLAALISTNGLSIGDRLIAFDEASVNYYYYSLIATGWNPLTVVNVSPDSTNHVVDAPALSTIAKAQGYAFWLKTANPTTAYLQGVVNTNAAVAIAANAFTLIGNALPTALDLNAPAFTNANLWFTAGPPGFGDEIHVVNGSNYVKNVFFSGSWKLVEQTPSNTVFTADSANIPAGSGVWYKRIGSSANFILK